MVLWIRKHRLTDLRISEDLEHAQGLSRMEPEQLNDFLEYVQDIIGYLTALNVNFIGYEEKTLPYLEFLKKVGEADVDPVDFYECITELHAVLGLMYSVDPRVGGEVVPCVHTIEALQNLFRMKQ